MPPIVWRYSGCEKGTKPCQRLDGRSFKVLEYLLDFSVSRFAIPQAIEDPSAQPIAGGQFELLLVAESELGTQTEVCRDQLKLLDARAQIRCLVYRQPSVHRRQAFQARMLRVLHNHAHFAASPGLWLFVALSWEPTRVGCTITTLSDGLDSFVPLQTT